MKFTIDKIKRLYENYYRLYILTDDSKYNTYIDIHPYELRQLKDLLNHIE